MQITPEAAEVHREAERRHHLRALRPLRSRNQHPLRHLPAARTARTLRRRQGRGARRLQRRARQRRQVGRQPGSPSPRSPSRKPAPTSKRCSTSRRPTATSTRRSWATEPGGPRPRVAALALAVGLVLADSSIVVLALPEIYRELDTSVAGVTWVLVSFNLVMALAAVPAALLARRVGAGRAAAVGLAIFAGAGLACGLSDDLSTLILARCVQALGGALAVTAALELLPASGRLRAPGGGDLGQRRRDRRRARAGDRRCPHRARLLAVDLPPPGAGGARRRGADPRRRPPRGLDPGDRARAAPHRPAAPAGPTWRWRWSRRRSRRRSSCSSCS